MQDRERDGLWRLLAGLGWHSFFFAYQVSVPCKAQTSCSGVLGKAIISETFGSKSQGPLPSGQTNYMYVTGKCPDDGQYTLADSATASCFGYQWHEVTEDHTPGDVDGDMLIVNASYGQDQEFYNQAVYNLCPGTTYEFSVWILNLMNPLSPRGCGMQPPRDPNIMMRIETADGTVIEQYTTGPIGQTNAPVWVQRSLLFTVPANVSSVIVRLINRGQGGCGNDLAMDDIQLSPCQPILRIQFDNTSTSDLTLCEKGSTVIRSSVQSGYLKSVYQWQESQDNANWTDISNARDSVYTLQTTVTGKRYYRLLAAPALSSTNATTAQCKAISDTLSVTTVAIPQVNLGRDTVLCEGRLFQLSAPAVNDVNYLWSDGSTSNQLVVTKAGDYWLQANRSGCLSTDSVSVNFQKCPAAQLFIPDVFTPNNDGLNDYFDIYANEDVAVFGLKIYNRWGAVVFTSDQLSQKWDGTYQGKPCVAGTYTWVVDYASIDGNKQSQKHTQKGQLLLLR